MFGNNKSGVSTMDLNGIKAFSKEERQDLALSIKRDPELWNTINGLGGLSEESSKGRLQGTVVDGEDILIGAEVKITDNNDVITTVKTNQYGYYSIDLDSGNFVAEISYDNEQSDEISVQIKSGIVSTLNHDFDE